MSYQNSIKSKTIIFFWLAIIQALALKLNTFNKSRGQQDLVAATQDMDHEVFRELYDKAVREKNIITQQRILREMNAEQRLVDRRLHDQTAEELLERTSLRRQSGDLGDEEREAALKELLDQYPDSYAAAKAVSNAVIDSVRKNDIESAEDHYNLLFDLQAAKADSVVLDSGMEAVPQMSNALAYGYMRSGMTDKIGPIIDNLETNYSDSLIALRFPRGGSKVVTCQEAVDRIRRVAGIE